MLKKLICFLFAVLFIFSAFTVNVVADEVFLGINCVAKDSDASGKRLVVYFKNIATEEIISFNISTIGLNKFYNTPPGEYEYIKCALKDHEDIVYELASKKENLIVKENEYSFYTFRLAKTATETREGAFEELELTYTLIIISIIMFFVILALAIVWLVFGILGRKNYHHKTWAKLFSHLFFAAIGLLVGLLITNADTTQFWLWIVFACFPYGCFLCAGWFYGSTDEEAQARKTDFDIEAENRSASIALILTIVLGAILGVIAFPIVLIRDIIRICKSRNPYYI
ncbi:MAG: hypothetical protein E7562_04755 [Ruminococcaceae bacterium]|nr:hypothetical protein [Oscillospiraceae bacterium]